LSHAFSLRNFLKDLARKKTKFKNKTMLIWKEVCKTKTQANYSLADLRKCHMEDRITRLTYYQCCELGSVDKGHREEQQWKSLMCSKSTCRINLVETAVIKFPVHIFKAFFTVRKVAFVAGHTGKMP
jgi:hypothetical protein